MIYPSGGLIWGFYYGISLLGVSVGWEGVCFPFLLGFSLSVWECFLFRLASRGGYWFVILRPVFSSPCSFLPLVPNGGFITGQGQRVFSSGIAGQTIVGGF